MGPKLEHYILQSLIKDGYKVDFHKEQVLSNTKLQIDLFLPTMNVAMRLMDHLICSVWGSIS